MVKIGVAANAFKGSLSAVEATDCIAAGLERSSLPCVVHKMPLADGGDGTLEVILSQPGSVKHEITVTNALGDPVEAAYGILADGQTAVVEMALASGLAILGSQRDPLGASTTGTGQLIHHAIKQGAKRIILGVGGSATTDAGTGCLTALGAKFLDNHGKILPPGGGALDQLAAVETDALPDDLEILVLCDVDNPPIGKHGAAAVFSPQKGASPEQVALLEYNLTHFFSRVAELGYRDVRSLAGGGAAGALAGGLAALAQADLVPGAATLLEFLGHQERMQQCDLVITGEGKIDAQTVHGKTPAVVANIAAANGIPCIAIAGGVDPDVLNLTNIQAMYSPAPGPVSLDKALANAATWLERAALQIGNTLSIGANFRD